MRGCIINCSQVFTDEQGELITSGLEFETIGLVGSNCQISDIDQIARIDRLCDDLGLDTMDVGAAMGVAMEAGLLRWGDGVAAFDMLSRLSSGDENARLLASGCAVAGRALGVSRIPGRQGAELRGLRPARAQGHRHHLRHGPAGR